MILMFAKSSFSACIDRPSSCNDLRCVDHSDKWSRVAKPSKQKGSPVRIGRSTMRLV
jgi:hypothetical protein